ncbi:Peptidyl-prolyl cis-trans isomerase [Mycena indigotica]|uniref:Peptidyl-prolyl cis-trans isomerase n=1 Tax=Mycena indigotica TaxID=2126181 RepID=A0A8H6T2W8_9AGAR|nr:Peptidyl-prolyl cis-trans isomerase [Mycena indigotica]KAF7309382.1 Peptidyl-prolyl cis-trans isomerase [Mycena indigotica]
MALPTNGRVIIDTTVGEIDIELWSKETPKTCRNFITLALEGYYDGVIFHRVVPGFLVQTGDRTGTGGGGESIYGGASSTQPFEDEIHPRLRFAHRGIVAMANNGTKNSNDSQFIITLDRADELHGKHTLFGRCMGDTIYNVMKIGEMELGENERPVYPPKIKSIRIVDNPFDDIVPRITAAEKRAQQRAREAAQKEREEAERRKGAKKNVALLSFGEDEDPNAEPVSLPKKGKGIARPDLMDTTGQLPDFINKPTTSQPSKPIAGSTNPADDRPKKKKEEDITKIREKHAQELASSANVRKTEIANLEAEIRSLQKRRGGGDSDDELEAMRKQKKTKSYLEEELARYSKGRGLHSKRDAGGKRVKDESNVLAALNAFRGKLARVEVEMPDAEDGDGKDTEKEGPALADDPGIEVDDDAGFLSHALHFPKDDGEETMKAERDYEVIDPRVRGARAKEEERQRKKQQREKQGRGRNRY